jgi:hypothetical protein
MAPRLALVLAAAACLGPLAASSAETAPNRAIAVVPNAGAAAAGPKTEDADIRARLLALFKVKRPGLAIEQIPPSPVPLGTKGIRFRLVPERDGHLVLLSLSDEGEVVQLFPTRQSERHGKTGAVRAGRPITVPDPSYGVSIDATSVTKGTVLALVTRQALASSRRFATRAIMVVPREEVQAVVLPELVSVLEPSGGGASPAEAGPNVRAAAALRYEIVP